VIFDYFSDHLREGHPALQRNTEDYRRILSAYMGISQGGLTLVDLSDSFADPVPILIDLVPGLNVEMVFKREKKSDVTYAAPTIPFPFLFPRYPDSYYLTNFERSFRPAFYARVIFQDLVPSIPEESFIPIRRSEAELPYILSFGGAIGSNRGRKLDALRTKLGSKLWVYSLPYSEHIKFISHSRFSLCIHGAGEYCNRFREIAYAGSCPVVEKYSIDIPNDFTDMKNIIYFERAEELPEKLSEVNLDARNAIATEFRNHYLRFHGIEAWTLYLLEAVSTLD
jgi:hypothetical protein